MNYRRVARILGLVLFVVAAAELVPLAIALAIQEDDASFGFGVGAVVTAGLGFFLRRAGEGHNELFRREGVLIVVASWGVASLFGAIPYVVSGAIPDPIDALFESASGFTTTGASILTDIEAVDRAVLFWRSLTQWLGGIGIVVLFVALLAELGPGARFLFKLEVPGPKSEIFHARVRETAMALFRIYIGLSSALVACLLVLGLSFYDALAHTFSTVSTGGFSPYNDSMGHFGVPVQLVVTLFMFLSGINFSLYYATLRYHNARALRDPELRIYIGVTLAATLAVAVDLLPHSDSTWAAAVSALFHVVSVVTTTGYATGDFAAWPGLALACLVALMVTGGCAGSTAGGAKLVRVLVGWRAAMRDVRLTFSPNAVIAIEAGNETLPNEAVRAVLSFLVLFAAAWAVGTLALAVGDTDLLTASSASIASLSNIGPGLAAVGPAENYAFFDSWQKLVLVLLMWLGRLELFAVLALMQRRFWRV